MICSPAKAVQLHKKSFMSLYNKKCKQRKAEKMIKRKCLVITVGIISCVGMILLLLSFCSVVARESVNGAETGVFQPSASDFFFEHTSKKEITPLEWLSAAENGNAWAQCRVGDYYASGSGGFKYDPCEALKWWFKAAEQGDAAAKYRVFKFYWIESFEHWCEQHPFFHNLFF